MTNLYVASAAPPSKPRQRRRPGRSVAGFLMTVPAIVLVLGVFVVPLVLLAVMSFFNWPLLGAITPAGADNYLDAFSDPEFGRALIFTLVFTVVLVPLTIIVSYAAAVAVRTSSRYTTFLRTTFFLPVTIGFAAAAYMFSVLLLPGTGPINILLAQLGLTDGQTKWFTSLDSAFWAVIVISLWKGIGITMILLMAAMQAIPLEVYEASSIDGAGWFRREWSITLPLVRRQLTLSLILAITGTLLTFDQFFVLTKGGPANETVTAVFYTYLVSFVRYDLGYGAALSLLISVIIVAAVLLQIRVMRRGRGEES